MVKLRIHIVWMLCCIAAAGRTQTDSAVHIGANLFKSGDSSRASYQTLGKAITGTAVPYSKNADGINTANGEIFDNKLFTAACNKFKFNSWLKITNARNQKTVFVRVNDRNSRKKTAPLIELSRAAVSVLGFLKTGTAIVKIEEIIINDSFLIINNNSDKKILQPAGAKDTGLITKTDTLVTGKPVTGIASFYSTNLDGTKTSTGERYRNAKLTAASNHFKLNSWVRVTNLRNQRSVVVRINDRMHPRMKKKGRVVDLSREAARQLDFMDLGLVKVKVEQLVFKNGLTDTSGKQRTDSSIYTIQDSTHVAAAPADSLPRQTVIPETDSPDMKTAVTGLASFYSTELDGTKTATGEIYRNAKLSAACNLFALGTRIKVINLSNQKSIVVRINDRMHPKMQRKGRVVDLSRAAAKKLGFINKGLTKVSIEPVERN